MGTGVIETGTLIAITAATTAASAGMAYYSAQQQNKSAQSQMDAAAEQEKRRRKQSRLQAAIVNKQVTDQSVVQAERLARQAARVRGAMRTTSAELAGQAGAGMDSASLGRNLVASILQESSEARLIGKNLENVRAKLESGVGSGDLESIARIQNAVLRGEAMSQNPFLSAAAGGISGLGTGLSISGGVQQMGWLDGGTTPVDTSTLTAGAATPITTPTGGGFSTQQLPPAPSY